LEYFGLYISGESGHIASDCKKWSVSGVCCKKEEEKDSVYFRSLSFDFVDRMMQLCSEFSQVGTFCERKKQSIMMKNWLCQAYIYIIIGFSINIFLT